MVLIVLSIEFRLGDKMELKDPSKRHFQISMVKSAIRIVGCFFCLYTADATWLASGFLVGEILGIAEEL